MTCKLTPTITPSRITLKETPEIIVEARIAELSPLIKDENLQQYLEAVCVISSFAVDDPGDLWIKDWLDEGKNWWSEYSKWWYDLGSVDAYLAHSVITPVSVKEPIKFEIDMNSLFIEKAEGRTEEFTNLWDDVENLSYFIYIQVNTQQMAEDFNITIGDEYKGLLGVYKSGAIITDKNINTDIVQDLRCAEGACDESGA
jgi:hypothetical protein